MAHAPSAKTGLDALLTPEESVLVLIGHQPFQFANPGAAGVGEHQERMPSAGEGS
jgi:hypothetical protein